MEENSGSSRLKACVPWLTSNAVWLVVDVVLVALLTVEAAIFSPLVVAIHLLSNNKFSQALLLFTVSFHEISHIVAKLSTLLFLVWSMYPRLEVEAASPKMTKQARVALVGC